MKEQTFNKIFDGFCEEQKLLGYTMVTDSEAFIIGHFISYLENAGLLKDEHHQLAAANDALSPNTATIPKDELFNISDLISRARDMLDKKMPNVAYSHLNHAIAILEKHGGMK